MRFRAAIVLVICNIIQLFLYKYLVPKSTFLNNDSKLHHSTMHTFPEALGQLLLGTYYLEDVYVAYTRNCLELWCELVLTV